jgi:hypothetical protein
MTSQSPHPGELVPAEYFSLPVASTQMPGTCDPVTLSSITTKAASR